MTTWFSKWLACATTGTHLNGEILRRTTFMSWASSINPEQLAKFVVAQQPQGVASAFLISPSAAGSGGRDGTLQLTPYLTIGPT